VIPIEKKPYAFQQESDSMLIEQAFQGNHKAFEILMHRYSPYLFTFVRKHSTDHETAEDILQSVFLQLYLSLPQLHQHLSSRRTAHPLRAWLLRVALNRCIDESRQWHPSLFSDTRLLYERGETQEEFSPEENIIDPSPLPEEATVRQELRYTIQSAIEALPVSFRKIVQLRYREDLTFKEIENRLHIPVNTVRTYYRRALPLLRASLVAMSVQSRQQEKKKEKMLN
jgi:RNA polymerase sigma factor (sigma-70 family)